MKRFKLLSALCVIILLVSTSVIYAQEPAETSPISEEEISHPLLIDVFSDVTFYKVTDWITLPPSFSITAEYKGTEYPMPSQFNELMRDYGIELTESNTIALAKALALISRPYDIAEISSTDESLIDEVKDGIPFQVRLKTWSRTNGVCDEWEFSIKDGQFSLARVTVTGSRVGDYIEDPEGPFPSLDQ